MRAKKGGESGYSETLEETSMRPSTAAYGRGLDGPSCPPPLRADPLDEARGAPSELHSSGGVASGPISPAGQSFGELAEQCITIFSELNRVLGFPRSKTQNSGSVFPLPETFAVLSSLCSQLSEHETHMLQYVCMALNSYYGTGGLRSPPFPRAMLSAVATLGSLVTDCDLVSKKLEGLRWERYMECRSVDYRGEEVKVAKAFSWENIEPSLPDGIGSIPLQEICELGTLDYVMNFERYLLPSDSQVYTKPPRVLVADHSWEQVCKGLMAKEICRLIPESQVYHVQDKPLLSGLFAVSKEEWDGPWEICRLIMNLVPLNKLCRSLGGDISTLPSWAGMSPYILEDSEVLLLSSEDIRCFFYLFSVPASWHRFLAFGRPVPSTLLPQGTRETHYLCSLVLPLGFLNSVSIAQHIHRRIAILSLHGVLPSRGPQNELRKDKPFSSSDWLYRIYLDNYDSLQKTDKHLASQIQGEVSVESLALRQGYQHWGLPRHPKKSVQQATKAEISGAWVDGETGRVKPKAEKVLKYVELALALLKEEGHPETNAGCLWGFCLLQHVPPSTAGFAQPRVDLHFRIRIRPPGDQAGPSLPSKVGDDPLYWVCPFGANVLAISYEGRCDGV